MFIIVDLTNKSPVIYKELYICDNKVNTMTDTVGPTTPKLDLSQITSHPIVQQRLQEEKTAQLQQANSSPKKSSSPLKTTNNINTFTGRPNGATPATYRELSATPVRIASSPAMPVNHTRQLSERSANQINITPQVGLTVPRFSQHAIFASPGNQAALIKPKQQRPDSVNYTTITRDQNGTSESDSNNNTGYRVRRSTSLSYTSTLRKRRNQNDTGDLYNLELPSPKPNIVLPNFSISPYSESKRKFNLNE